jgi:polyhydroxyalkanoate synthesis regulator phasin
LLEETEALRIELSEKENEIKAMTSTIGTTNRNKLSDMQNEIEALEERVKELTDELEANEIVERV